MEVEGYERKAHENHFNYTDDQLMEKQLALKQKAEEEERIKVENQRIKEWEEKFDLEQKKKEEELIKKFYSDDYSSQNKQEEILETTPDNNKEN